MWKMKINRCALLLESFQYFLMSHDEKRSVWRICLATSSIFFTIYRQASDTKLNATSECLVLPSKLLSKISGCRHMDQGWDVPKQKTEPWPQAWRKDDNRHCFIIFAHGGSGDNWGAAFGLIKGTALKYVDLIAKLITTKIALKWMSDAIFNCNYTEGCRARFHALHAFTNIGGCTILHELVRFVAFLILRPESLPSQRIIEGFSGVIAGVTGTPVTQTSVRTRKPVHWHGPSAEPSL